MKVHPDTLYITHIFDGEEVVRGGDDGQEWVATFDCPRDAQLFIDAAKKREADEYQPTTFAPSFLDR